MIGIRPANIIQPVYKTSTQMKKYPQKSSENPKKNSKKTNKIDLKKAYNYNYTDQNGKGFSAYA